MRKLTIDDIKDVRAYERERDEFRAQVIAMKKRRRIPLGDLMTIVFENTDTMRFQVQEMARAERMATDAQIRDALTGLKCRCGTHVSIMRAIKRAQAQMA